MLVLALSCVPCADGLYSAGNGRQAAAFVKAADHQHDREHSDTCSPLCQCACCASVLLSPAFINVSRLTDNSATLQAADLSADVIEISLPVWQPPQLTA
ncbi:hypothetical protein GCM10009415_53760 [Chitinophaga japonensis]